MLRNWFLPTNNDFKLTFYWLAPRSALEISRNSQGNALSMSVVVQNANSVIQAQPFTINRIKLAKQDKPVTIQRTNLNSKQIHVPDEKMHASQLQGLFHLTRIHRKNMREPITNKPSVNCNFWKVCFIWYVILVYLWEFCHSKVQKPWMSIKTANSFV